MARSLLPPEDAVSSAGALTEAAARGTERWLLGEGAVVELTRNWLAPDEATSLYATLASTIAWREERVRVRGREHVQPRLVAWYGDPGAVYTYSGLTLAPAPWVDLLGSLRARAGAAARVPFNAVLCNWYRDGRDSMGFHADDEPELGPAPVIASLSLGATRRFAMRHVRPRGGKLDLDLESGSLLVMSGTTQRFWRHAVPKRPAVPDGRINLTFRRVLAIDGA